MVARPWLALAWLGGQALLSSDIKRALTLSSKLRTLGLRGSH
jgi:hypothetical protein